MTINKTGTMPVYCAFSTYTRKFHAVTLITQDYRLTKD